MKVELTMKQGLYESNMN